MVLKIRGSAKQSKNVFSPFTFYHSISFAFTLSEVIITLGIIGVVAAISIPALLNNVQDAQYKTAYRKAFSIANQAWAQAVADNEIVSRTTWTDSTARVANFNTFKSKFTITKYCDGTIVRTTNCWNTSGEGYNGGGSPPSIYSPGFIDNSGMNWVDEGNGSGILVDTNGFAKPNRFGKDRFILITATADKNMWTAGIPVIIIPSHDYIASDADHCIYGGCYYKTWLIE